MVDGLRRVRIDWKFATLICKPGETMGDMPFALCGPDMYQVPLQQLCCYSTMLYTAEKVTAGTMLPEYVHS